jgi:hypothetical protein
MTEKRAESRVGESMTDTVQTLIIPITNTANSKQYNDDQSFKKGQNIQ